MTPLLKTSKTINAQTDAFFVPVDLNLSWLTARLVEHHSPRTGLLDHVTISE